MTSSASREMTEQEMINTSTAPQMAHLIQVLRQTIRNKDKEIEKWVDMVKQLQRDGELDPPEPKPLLADAKAGDLCMLRNGGYTQIDSVKRLGGKTWYDRTDRYTSYPDGRLFKGENNESDIIATEPLAEVGSAEWAWQMMKLGNKVRNSDWDDGTYERSLLYCQLIGETIKYNEGCSAFDVCLSDWEAPYIKNTGWQIYEPKPESQYKVGDWVEHKESKEQATIRRIMSYGAIEIEFAYSTESDIYQANDFHNDFRKLSPSEVIVKIGCLEGTVEKAQDYAYFLLWHSKTDCDYSMIKWDALDTRTSELVESLLKAQEVRNDLA